MKNKEFLIKCIITTIVLYIVFRIWGYYYSGIFVSISIDDLVLLFFFFIGVMILGSFLILAQKTTGDLMEGSWSKRIIFIIVAIVMIYLYKSTGRI